MKSDLQEYIQWHKGQDSDYWSYGNSDILGILIGYTEKGHWEHLQNDLVNWSFDEVEILANALSDEHDSRVHSTRIESILVQRSSLFAYILAYADENIFFDSFDRIDFIFDGDKKPLPVLIEIQKRIEKLRAHPSFETYLGSESAIDIQNKLHREIQCSR